MNNNIYAVFSSHFPADRDRVFIETDAGASYTYRDLERQTARLAAFFTALGLVPGDRVAVQVDKSPQAYFLYLATVRAGLVYLPLNPAYQSGELEHFIADAKPRAAIARPAAMTTLQRLVFVAGGQHVLSLDENGEGTLTEAAAQGRAQFDTAVCPADDLAVILYTSGTTGRSKGAMISHGNLAANGTALAQAWGFGPNDVLLHALPIFHIHGLFLSSHCTLLSGSKMLLMSKFDAPGVVEALPRATVFMGVPTYYTRLLAEPGFNVEACRTVRLFVSGSAPLLSETFNAFKERTGHAILERYGMTETGVNTSNPLHGERIAGTVGLALPGQQVRVVDASDQPLLAGEIGSIQAKGANVFSGYWRMPERTREEFTADGYFRTGDMGMFDALGYLSIVGRSKDMIISGGLNVYPKEVEAVIDEMPGVVESAVIGLPHLDFGEAVSAVVIRAPESPLTEESIVAAVRGKLANFKIPKRVFFVEDLPRNTMGKVQKNLLRDRYQDAFEPTRGA
jgi:malonyl-CoA/methylmalonyl-CoA synthetase